MNLLFVVSTFKVTRGKSKNLRVVFQKKKKRIQIQRNRQQHLHDKKAPENLHEYNNYVPKDIRFWIPIPAAVTMMKTKREVGTAVTTMKSTMSKCKPMLRTITVSDFFFFLSHIHMIKRGKGGFVVRRDHLSGQLSYC